jgi:hypothetical protein
MAFNPFIRVGHSYINPKMIVAICPTNKGLTISTIINDIEIDKIKTPDNYKSMLSTLQFATHNSKFDVSAFKNMDSDNRSRY